MVAKNRVTSNTIQTDTRFFTPIYSNLVNANFRSEEENKPAEKKTAENKQIEIERSGTQIILPEEMSFQEAITALQRKMQEDETIVRIHEEIECFPLDGAHALINVLKEMFGWASPIAKIHEGLFGKTEVPPTMINLEIDHGIFTQIFWGQFEIPGIEGRIETSSQRAKGKFLFVLSGSVKKKHQKLIDKISNSIREFLKTKSIYKGKAIRLLTNDGGDFDPTIPPVFMDTSNVKEEELVLPAEIREQVETSLFTPIEHSHSCRQLKIPLKRGILLEGPYGTGKTLTAYVTAKKSIDNGWTFIYLDRVTGLRDAFQFAKLYAPAVVFAEDVDRVTSGDRDMDLDDVLNQIDGIDSKNTEIITILTTNHVEKINRAMIRPERLDAVISIMPPDAKSAEKLISIYGRDLLDADTDLEAPGIELAGQIPAVIREAVERSKLFAIHRAKGGENISLYGEDIVAAAKGMKRHLALLKEPIPAINDEEACGIAFTEIIKKAVKDRFNSIDEKLEDM